MARDLENAADARMPGDALEDRRGNALTRAAARKPKRKRKFIAGAIKHPGSLHAALGVPQGQRIPASRVSAAARSGSKNLRAKANLALTLEGLSKKK